MKSNGEVWAGAFAAAGQIASKMHAAISDVPVKITAMSNSPTGKHTIEFQWPGEPSVLFTAHVLPMIDAEGTIEIDCLCRTRSESRGGIGDRTWSNPEKIGTFKLALIDEKSVLDAIRGAADLFKRSTNKEPAEITGSLGTWYLAVCPGSWGRGRTADDAVKQLKKHGGKLRDYTVTRIDDEPSKADLAVREAALAKSGEKWEGPYISGDGMMCYHGKTRVVMRVRGGKPRPTDE